MARGSRGSRSEELAPIKEGEPSADVEPAPETRSFLGRVWGSRQGGMPGGISGEGVAVYGALVSAALSSVLTFAVFFGWGPWSNHGSAAVTPTPTGYNNGTLSAYQPPRCSGPCCSSQAMFYSASTPSFASSWWSLDFYDGATVQLRSAHKRLWVGPEMPGEGWGRPGAYHKAAELSSVFTVERVGERQIRLRTPKGTYLMADEAGLMHATELTASHRSVIYFEKAPSGSADVVLKTFRGADIFVTDSGALGHAFGVLSRKSFSVQETMLVPSFRGVGLPGWLVAEAWINPDLFQTVPVYLDGLQFQLQSLYTGEYVSVKQFGQQQKEVVCDAKTPKAWETFHLRSSFNDTALHQIRCLDFSFWRVPSNVTTAASPGINSSIVYTAEGGFNSRDEIAEIDQSQAAVAAAAAAAAAAAEEASSSTPDEAGRKVDFLFRFHRNPHNPNWVMIQSVATGNFLEVGEEDGSLTASATAEQISVAPNSPHWAGRTAFLFAKTSGVRGEWQLGRALGVKTAQRALDAHRGEWVKESDFKELQGWGVNAVRIPVGYWLAQEGMELEAKSKGGVLAGAGAGLGRSRAGEALDVTLPGMTVAADGPDYPFTRGGLAHLDSAFEWGRKYGIRVFLSLHAAPGSQNGFEHSASRDGISDWSNDDSNVALTVAAVEWLTARYTSHAAFAGIGLLNEPLADGVPLEVLRGYYKRAYEAVRRHSKCAFVSIMSRVGEDASEVVRLLGDHDRYTNIIPEEHFYNIFEGKESLANNLTKNLEFVSQTRAAEIDQLQKSGRPVLVGEWALAIKGHQNLNQQEMGAFAKAQIGAYASADAGWFFFSHKMARPIWNHFSFISSIQNGWIPADALF